MNVMRWLADLWEVFFGPHYPCVRNHPHATIEGRDSCNEEERLRR